MNDAYKPPRVLIAAQGDELNDLAQGLSAAGAEVSRAGSGGEALVMAGREAPDLVAAGQDLGDMTGLELARQLIQVNALINTALVSPLSPEEFHEATEGLGLLAQLPPNPPAVTARELLALLARIAGLTVQGRS